MNLNLNLKKNMARFGMFCLVIFAMSSMVIANAAAKKDMPKYPVTGHWKGNHTAGAQQKLTKLIAEPRTVSWEDAMKFFDFDRTLPKPTAAELQYELGLLSKQKIKTVHIADLFGTVYQLDFTQGDYGLSKPVKPEEEWLQTFGDIMAHFKSFKKDPAKTEASLNKIKSSYPKIWAEVSSTLPQLVRADFLYSEKWTPWSDGTSAKKSNDAILFYPYWLIKPNETRPSIWNQQLGEHKVYQGGVFIYASIQEIKKTERNYKQYFDHAGMGFLEVAPVEGSYIRGVDPKGHEFVGLETFFRQDLPFPYDSTRYTMKIFDYYNDKGYYVSDYYSLNRSDLNWMAGRDIFYPVKNKKGEQIGYLISTELDFDIKSLPERDKDRIMSIRGAWGNIKPIAEGYGVVSKVGVGAGSGGK